MGVLVQFQKKGGFRQLLLIFELTEPAKQKNLFHLVATEDPGWAHLLRIKMLTFERVCQWPTPALKQVLSPLPAPLLGHLHGLATASQRHSLEKALPPRALRELKEWLNQNTPNPNDAWFAQIKLVQGIREMESLGLFSPAEVDPTLELDQRLVS